MKEGWEYIDFKDVYPISMGKTPPRGDKSSWDVNKETHNKWVSIADISQNEGGIINNTKEYISDIAAERIRKVAKGSLLMSFKLSIGRMAFAGDDLYTNEAIIAIPEVERYGLKFMYYYLLSYDWVSLTQGNEKVKGATLNKGSIGKIQLPILPLSEQEEIVSYLDSSFAKIDALKAKAEEGLKNAKALFQAELTKAMTPQEGWEEKKLGDCFPIIRNGANIKQTKGAGGIPITRIETLSGGVFNSDRLGYADINDIEKYSQHILNDGDLLMSHINSVDFVGRTVPYHEQVTPLIHGMNLLRLVPNEIGLSDFYYYLFLTKDFKKSIRAITHKSVNQASFNITALKAISIPIPPLSTQEVIVTHLDAVSEKCKALEANYTKQIQLCDDMKQALLRQVFE